MSDSWTVSVGGRTYGPYSDAQMQAFAGEGRLAPTSLVARKGDSHYKAASEDSTLSTFFRAKPPAMALAQALNGEEDPPVARFGRKDDETGSGELTHYVIVADMKSRSITGLEEEIHNLGLAYAVMPQVWLLTSDMSVNSVRNTLVQKLGKLDMLFVVDATHDKAAWFNFGPESDTRIRRIWSRAYDGAPRKVAS
jgi:hypothetical protein